MKGLVFGNGYIGGLVAKEFKIPIYKGKIGSATDILAVLFEKRPKVIFNCIGKTGRPNIDELEDKEDITEFTNVELPVLMSAAAQSLGIYMIHFGSGCIYQGTKGKKGFKEYDKPNHFNVYASSKIICERMLPPSVLQVRLRMPIDGTRNSRNLLSKIFSYKAVVDAQNSMTVLPEAMKALKILVKKRKTGVYNLVNPGTISPYEICVLKSKLDGSPIPKKLSPSALDNLTRARRSNCTLDVSKVMNVPGVHLSPAKEIVAILVQRYLAEGTH